MIAGQWIEVCVALPVLSALDAGYDVYVVKDACGSASREAHDITVERIVQADAHPITTWAYVSELAARLATCSNRRTGHQIIRTAGRRFSTGAAVGVGPAEPQGRHALIPALGRGYNFVSKGAAYG